MTEWIWNNGRFGWPLVIAVVLLSLVLLLADLAWRIFVVPAETLALLVGGASIIITLAFVGLRFLFRPGRRRLS